MSRLITERYDSPIPAEDITPGLGYREAETCANCKYSGGPTSDMECKSKIVKALALKSRTSIISDKYKVNDIEVLISPRMVCDHWGQG